MSGTKPPEAPNAGASAAPSAGVSAASNAGVSAAPNAEHQTVVARSVIYRGGGSVPFEPGATLTLPAEHAAELARGAHIETHEARDARLKAEAAKGDAAAGQKPAEPQPAERAAGAPA